MRRSVSQILLFVILFSGCGGGPKIELCAIDGDNNRRSLDCGKDGLGQYTRTIEVADGYICQSRAHTERFFRLCRDKQPIITEFCQISASDNTLYCAALRDGNEVFYQVSWSEASGYVCTNGNDLERYLDWCYR